MYIDEHGRKVLVGQEALDGFAKGISRLLENRKLHYRTKFQDLPVSVENRKGSFRSGVDPDGDEWRTKMKHPYGYIPGTKGADGDAVDCFVGPCEDAPYAYVVHSNNPETGEFDEDKVMLGFESASSAKRVFMQHYDDPKFFGGMDSIPMWKFRNMVWMKKHTKKKLVASVRESQRFKESVVGIKAVIEGMPIFIFVATGNPPKKEGNPVKTPTFDQGYVPAGMFATGSLTRETVREVKKNYGGQAHIFTSQKRMKRAMLGHHQDIMLDPQTREGASLQVPEEFFEKGVKGMKWGNRRGAKKGGPRDRPQYKFSSDKRAALAELPPAKASDLSQALRTENLHLRARMRGGNYNQKQTDMAKERIQQNEEMIAHYDQQKEAREHGTKGMQWGVRHVRKDAAGQKHPKTGKGVNAMRRDLQNDPKTLNMMGHVSKGQAAIAHLNAQRQQQKQNGQQQQHPKDAHQEALNHFVNDLGWKAAGAVGRLTGMGGVVDRVQSILRSPAGQKLFLNTDKQGNHSLSKDPKGKKKIKASFRESLGRFLREAKKKIYYARSLQHYGKESKDLDALEEAFPGADIGFPKTRKHASLGMRHFHKQVDAATDVVIRPYRKRRITAGVFSEAQHALHKGKRVHMMIEGKLRRVKRLEMLEDGDPAGSYARVILRKIKKK